MILHAGILAISHSSCHRNMDLMNGLVLQIVILAHTTMSRLQIFLCTKMTRWLGGKGQCLSVFVTVSISLYITFEALPPPPPPPPPPLPLLPGCDKIPLIVCAWRVAINTVRGHYIVFMGQVSHVQSGEGEEWWRGWGRGGGQQILSNIAWQCWKKPEILVSTWLKIRHLYILFLLDLLRVLTET